MSFYNSYPSFLYRQFLVCTPKAPPGTSLQGKAGIVTGSNIGMGYQASTQLLRLDLTYLILAVRNPSKGEITRTSLLASLPKFVNHLQKSGIYIDFALLNAGVANFNYTQTPSTSHESSVQINWPGTALLTLLLLFDLKKQAVASPTRPRPMISIVGSETAAWAKFKEAQISTTKGIPLIEVLDDKTNFDMGDRYYTSKLLYQLLFLRLVRSHRSGTHGAILNLVNPGLCYGSELHRTAEGAFGGVLSGMKRLVGRALSMGARTLVHAAVLAGESSDGKYLSDCKMAPFAGYGNSDYGRKMQTQVWKETAAELSRVLDMDKLLLEI